ncbi:MAG: dethiobiotin synthase, partial [Kiritimatiellia bacterium]|nr:dethiobiotin synthase [Kiritimatiellia bacterium]
MPSTDKHLFITGTDTDAGKTIITAALLIEAIRRGMNALPMKPVQTGCTGRGLE